MLYIIVNSIMFIVKVIAVAVGVSLFANMAVALHHIEKWEKEHNYEKDFFSELRASER